MSQPGFQINIILFIKKMKTFICDSKFLKIGILLLSLYYPVLHAQNSSVDIRQEENRASEEWIRKNTKPCPGCQVPIEKNGGCNYIVCTQCGLGFCYFCFRNHHGTACTN